MLEIRLTEAGKLLKRRMEVYARRVRGKKRSREHDEVGHDGPFVVLRPCGDFTRERVLQLLREE